MGVIIQNIIDQITEKAWNDYGVRPSNKVLSPFKISLGGGVFKDLGDEAIADEAADSSGVLPPTMIVYGLVITQDLTLGTNEILIELIDDSGF